MTSENFVRTLWATIFFMSENYHNELKDSDFLSTILQVSLLVFFISFCL